MPIHMSVCGSRNSVFRPEGDSQISHAQNLATASSGSFFTMLFNSDEFVGKFEFGFRLEYKFQNLLSWKSSKSQKSVPKKTKSMEKDRVIYFNYNIETLLTSSSFGLQRWTILLFTLIGKHMLEL